MMLEVKVRRKENSFYEIHLKKMRVYKIFAIFKNYSKNLEVDTFYCNELKEFGVEVKVVTDMSA